MIFKSGSIRVRDIRPELVMALQIIDSIYKIYAGAECTITSINDGKHKAGSLHYKGKAADVRTKGHPQVAMQRIVKTAKALLDAEFDIVWEDVGLDNEHLHIEYDPK